MPLELVYTSAPKGLLPGSHGFCTVACTTGMSSGLLQTLELLSSYRRPQGLSDDKAPANYSLLHVKADGIDYNVLSRVATAGLDFTQRTNHLARHVAFLQNDCATRDPVFLRKIPA